MTYEKQEGEFIEVNAEQLRSYSGSSGFKLVKDYEVEAVTSVYENVPNPAYGPNSNYLPPTTQVQKSIVVKERRFLLVKDPDVTLQELRANLESTQKYLYEAGKKEAEHVKEKEALEKKLSAFAQVEKDAKEWRQKHESAMATQREWEGDFAKLRKAIGEIEFKRLVGD